MKFILFIATRLRSGQFPRLPDFQHSHIFNAYIYGGKPLDAQEFNSACEQVYVDGYRNQGFMIRPRVVTDAEVAAFEADIAKTAAAEKARLEAKPVPTPEPEPAAPEALADPEPQPEPDVTVDAKEFTLEGRSIMLKGERIAGIYGEDEKQHIRVMSDFSHLRPDIEAWYSTLNQ